MENRATLEVNIPNAHLQLSARSAPIGFSASRPLRLGTPKAFSLLPYRFALLQGKGRGGYHNEAEQQQSADHTSPLISRWHGTQRSQA
jgi:hypothetical protein